MEIFFLFNIHRLERNDKRGGRNLVFKILIAYLIGHQPQEVCLPMIYKIADCRANTVGVVTPYSIGRQPMCRDTLVCRLKILVCREKIIP